MLPRANALLLLAFLAGPALAQTAPFDMGAERGPSAPASPPAAPSADSVHPSSPAPAPVQTAPASPASPPVASPPVAPPSPAAAATAPASPADAPGAAAAASPWRRYLFAGSELSLSGEIDRRSWAIYLTREEAEAASRLQLAYQNAVLAAPETSQLRFLINDTALVQEPVASSDSVKDLAAAVPAGLLRPGLNTLTLETKLRHRTDCTVASTYDLWTTFDSTRSFLEFDGPAASFAPRRLDDLRATGLDTQGLTRIRLTVPDGELGDASATVLRLAQALSIVVGMPNQSVEVIQGPLPEERAGTLDVVVGPVGALGDALGGLEGAATSANGFLKRADGSSVLAVTGNGWDDVRAGVERVVSFAGDADSPPRPAVMNPALRQPDALLVREGGAVSFRDLGVASQEFAGRRFRTEFALAVPGDFFAEAYGEAVMRIDAAYSREILPGSLINLYVNGNIATTLPIGGGGAGYLDEFPLRMTMRHLRPGANTIALEANLLTRADEACAPGTPGQDVPRFALFDSSRIEIPDFARIARVPDLSAFQGVGFPYNTAREPVDVVLPDDRAAGLSAAASVVGRLAFAAGHVIPIAVRDVLPQTSTRALFIGTPRQIAPAVLARANIDPASAVQWGGQGPAPAASDGLTLDRWREQFDTSEGWAARVDGAMDWLRTTFSIEADGLRLIPRDSQPFAPGDGSALVVGQGEGTTSGSVWTVIAAPSTAALNEGINLLVRDSNWVQLAGRVSSYDGARSTMTSQPIGEVTFITTQPLSLANVRLIAANWLSENVLSYASLIVAVALLLGVATTVFVRSLGQR
ncbi:cellulose biosynthesis cyclic di-GMP-binding regulatory protein BcsB [Aureimonas sp. ME7]|uniref:cellulose biosynthesis cyclic di-GMP-binding regulatory protein BcsB n=1 Tax=Aureimonas sp. ME7 TaxID=2744252 RepID=UPI0015F61077|nr:cellulose biosynthesis cyclic di-GMP-binding regulatory protein BcsB [Aureimonas sp. ME7]